MGWFDYDIALEKEKERWPYQSLTFKVFREILPYVEERFRWEHSSEDYVTLLLYYVVPAKRAGHLSTRYLVDISYWQAKRFHEYHRKYLERKKAKQRREKIADNASMGILEDAQKVLEDEIRKNLKSVQCEAA